MGMSFWQGYACGLVMVASIIFILRECEISASLPDYYTREKKNALYHYQRIGYKKKYSHFISIEYIQISFTLKYYVLATVLTFIINYTKKLTTNLIFTLDPGGSFPDHQQGWNSGPCRSLWVRKINRHPVGPTVLRPRAGFHLSRGGWHSNFESWSA